MNKETFNPYHLCEHLFESIDDREGVSPSIIRQRLWQMAVVCNMDSIKEPLIKGEIVEIDADTTEFWFTKLSLTRLCSKTYPTAKEFFKEVDDLQDKLFKLADLKNQQRVSESIQSQMLVMFICLLSCSAAMFLSTYVDQSKVALYWAVGSGVLFSAFKLVSVSVKKQIKEILN